MAFMFSRYGLVLRCTFCYLGPAASPFYVGRSLLDREQLNYRRDGFHWLDEGFSFHFDWSSACVLVA